MSWASVSDSRMGEGPLWRLVQKGGEFASHMVVFDGLRLAAECSMDAKEADRSKNLDSKPAKSRSMALPATTPAAAARHQESSTGGWLLDD
jgi:flavin reductase (DIM6/NTAB) family NADH-FMN oxidoreductase RutF